MRKTLFIMTHPESDWERLAGFLETDRRIRVFHTGLSYRHPDDVRRLAETPHPRDNSAAVRADVILRNEQFTMRRLAAHYKFLFWSRDRAETLAVLTGQYGADGAAGLLGQRLWVMGEYRRRSPGPWNPSLEGEPLLQAGLG